MPDTSQREYNEQPLRGPFGGIQSEMPPDAIEDVGFSDTLNLLFRKGIGQTAPGYASLGIPAGETGQPAGIYDFFDAAANRWQVLAYNDALWSWDPVAGWSKITTASGPSGAPWQTFSFAEVNYQMCYSQGVDAIQCWAGGNNATTAPSGAPAAYFLMNLATHLIAGFITSGVGAPFSQRYMYSAAGDPTTWNSFDSGVYDLASELGPMTGLGKLQGIGYSLHRFGINQITPTGQASLPFYNMGLASYGKGCRYPYTPGWFGNEMLFYVGDSDVYMFNSQNIIPIGSRPMQGRGWLGARKRIFADLATVSPYQVFGAVSSVINGNDYNAYWLFIPGASTWIYNMDEGSWTRRVYDKTPVCGGRFYDPQGLTWNTVLGNWNQQAGVWNALGDGPDDQFLVAFTDGTPGLINFTEPCESSANLLSGECIMKDRRHNKFANRLRVTFIDSGVLSFTVTLTNENTNQQVQLPGTPYTETHTVTWSGNGTGTTRQATIPFKGSGMSLTYSIIFPAGTTVTIVEVTPIYSEAGEDKDLTGLTIV